MLSREKRLDLFEEVSEDGSSPSLERDPPIGWAGHMRDDLSGNSPVSIKQHLTEEVVSTV